MAFHLVRRVAVSCANACSLMPHRCDSTDVLQHPGANARLLIVRSGRASRSALRQQRKGVPADGAQYAEMTVVESKDPIGLETAGQNHD